MTQHIKTGGPAFPCVCTNDGAEEITGFNHDKIPARTTCQYRGLTMRDYFAAKAMQALIHVQVKTKLVQTTETAYEWADAMLLARKST